MAGYRGGGGGGGSANANIVWGFPGTLSTDQNGNLLRIRIAQTTSISAFDVYMVQAPVGGSTEIVFYKNGAIVATVTITAGSNYAETIAAVTYSPGDLLYAQVQSVAPTNPGVTATFRARAA